MLKSITKFIRELRDSDERRKKRWLFILSAGAMFIVVICWLIYLNEIIVDLGTKTDLSKDSGKTTFAQTFLLGLKIIGEQIKTVFLEIKDIVSKGREIKIEGFKN